MPGKDSVAEHSFVYVKNYNKICTYAQKRTSKLTY